MSVDGDANVHVGGDLTVDASTIDASASEITIRARFHADKSGTHNIMAGTVNVGSLGALFLVGSDVQVHGKSILLKAGGATIRMAGGNIAIHAPGVVDIKGGLIKLNS